MKLKKIIKFVRKNYFILTILIVLPLVGAFASYRIFFSKPTYVYVKVKVGQGLWWASTGKPSIWYANSIKKGNIVKDLAGNESMKIISVRRYPLGGAQYDVYLTARLSVGYDKKTKEYTFSRSTLSVGAPIGLKFPEIDITGTVIELSRNPFNDKYVNKTVYLVHYQGYSKDFPYRYEGIRIGDKYSDGEETVFEVVDKYLENNIWAVTNNFTGQVFEREVETTQNIVVKARVRVLQKEDGYYYANDQKLLTNSHIVFLTDNYFFENFNPRKIE